MKLRAYLLVLVAAAILPVAAFSTLVSVRGSHLYRDTLDDSMVATARALALAIESELSGSMRALQALGTSRYVDRGDFEAFRDQAQRVRSSQRWDNVWLADTEGRQVVNTGDMAAASPSIRDRDYFRRTLDTGQPYVSDVLPGHATGQSVVVVSVPVVRPDGVRYVLSAALRPETFARIMANRVTESGSIVDGRGVTLARMPNPELHVGRRASADYLRVIAGGHEGVARTATVDGTAAYAAFKRVPGTSWTVGIAIPAARVDAVLRSGLWPIVAGALIAAVLAGATAVVVARQLVTPLGAASRAALRLSRGEAPVAVPASRIVEVQALASSLETAGHLLHQRAEAAAGALREAQHARAEAEAAAARIDAESRTKDEFLAMLGHELRNPLAAIGSAAAILDRVHPDDQAALRARQIVGRQITHLIRIIDDLLDVGRVTAGKIVLDHRPVDLGAVARRAVEHLDASGKTARHDLSVSAAASVWVEGDEDRLEQIVTNLLTNALKYTPARGAIRVSVAREGGDAVLAVEDTGIGIEPDRLGAIFDLFVQGERGLDRREGGLGIGLTLVRKLVALHGGTVRAASDGPGRGSTLTVRIPSVAVPAAGARPGAVEATATRRIVVVEDNDDAREMLAELLRLDGHEVHVASSGEAGVRCAASVLPDAVLVDIGLPDIDGYTVARRLRHLPTGEKMLVVAISGYSQREDRRQSKEAGFDLHLVKPVDPERLHRLIGEHSPRTA